MNDKVEDILYQAHSEGIRDEVLNVSKSLSKDEKYKYVPFHDRLEIAYNKVKERGNKNNNVN